MGISSLELYLRNLNNIDARQTAEVYTEELKLAADLIDWEAQWHPHGKGPRKGSVVEGLGIGIHEWGGVANSSTCQLKVHPDGGVETYCGTQDIGTGTRTVCAMVVAETFGLPVEAVKLHIGHSTLPLSGASGGSTTVGSVAESHRRASQDVLAELNRSVAKQLNVSADSLEAVNGRIQVIGKPDQGLNWKEACSLIGINPIQTSGAHTRGDKSPLTNEGVGGVQIAHVAVDTETGGVKMKKLVAVQDMGLIINPMLAKSQIYGALIMGIAYSLFEQRINDSVTGAFVNAELGEYRLPRLGDIGELPELQGIETDGTGQLWIGAGVRLDEFMSSSLTDPYPAAKQVIQGISSIQLQAQASIAGELLRRPLCWYFRNGHGLLTENGKRVMQGDNRYHAILGNHGPAKFVNASRLAPVLISLGAKVRVVGPETGQESLVPLESLYRAPRDESQRENTLLPNQLLTHVILAQDQGDLSAAYEVRNGEGPDAPLAAAAATLKVVAGAIQRARIVMGQVAPIP
jgi:CO/xanthine dehydrogenase FAD-binding subunit